MSSPSSSQTSMEQSSAKNWVMAPSVVTVWNDQTEAWETRSNTIGQLTDPGLDGKADTTWREVVRYRRIALLHAVKELDRSCILCAMRGIIPRANSREGAHAPIRCHAFFWQGMNIVRLPADCMEYALAAYEKWAAGFKVPDKTCCDGCLLPGSDEFIHAVDDEGKVFCYHAGSALPIAWAVWHNQDWRNRVIARFGLYSILPPFATDDDFRDWLQSSPDRYSWCMLWDVIIWVFEQLECMLRCN